MSKNRAVMFYVGVDVGKRGAVAVVSSTGMLCDVVPMPARRRDLMSIFRVWRRGQFIVERVASSPKMGVKSAFTFGGQWERVLMGLEVLRVNPELVTPQEWQREVGLVKDARARGRLGARDKRLNLKRARECYDDPRVTLQTADAVLLAEFGRLTWGR